MQPLIVSNISKSFKGTPPVKAVDNISFSIEQGQILGLLGPNGAGKTTTLKILTSVLTSDEGSVFYFGKDLNKNRSDALQNIGFASTYTMLPQFLTVKQNLVTHGFIYGMSYSLIVERARQLMGYFKIEELSRRRFSQLSAGQKTRVMLVKAFLPKPKIVLLDEPTASLDPEVAEEVRKFISDQSKNEKTSVLITSHNMLEVTSLCDKVIFMNRGKIFAEDTPTKLAQSVRAVEIEFMGISDLETLTKVSQINNFQVTQRSGKTVIHTPQEKISFVLQEMAKSNLTYSNISIHPPTLEEFFLKYSKE